VRVGVAVRFMSEIFKLRVRGVSLKADRKTTRRKHSVEYWIALVAVCNCTGYMRSTAIQGTALD